MNFTSLKIHYISWCNYCVYTNLAKNILNVIEQKSIFIKLLLLQTIKMNCTVYSSRSTRFPTKIAFFKPSKTFFGGLNCDYLVNSHFFYGVVEHTFCSKIPLPIHNIIILCPSQQIHQLKQEKSYFW